MSSHKISATERRGRSREAGYIGPHEGQDQCGYCGCWFTPGPDDIDGVCYAHRASVYARRAAQVDVGEFW
jgi:hypothetical protein